jgi:putative transcriptional regulator
MGIVVNQPAANINFADLLVQLEVIQDTDLIQLPRRAGAVQVLKGGPVEPGRGFVLHSSDFFIENSTLPIDDGICLTATLDILKAIAEGRGPTRWVAALGYAGWGAGQLEQELCGNGWFATPGSDALLYECDVGSRWSNAFRSAGIDPRLLTADFGTA